MYRSKQDLAIFTVPSSNKTDLNFQSFHTFLSGTVSYSFTTKKFLKIFFLKANVSKMRAEPHIQFLFKVNQLNLVQTRGGGHSPLKPTISLIRVLQVFYPLSSPSRIPFFTSLFPLNCKVFISRDVRPTNIQVSNF